MGLKRLPNSENLNELLEIVENSNETIEQIEDDFLLFLSHFNIQPGENPVLKKIVLTLYKSWSKNPINDIIFWNKIAKHFFSFSKQSRYYLKINLDSIHLEKETLKILQSKILNKTKYPKYQNQFNKYLEFYNIKKGTKFVPSFVLYHFYDKWCYITKKKQQLSEISFFNFCKLHFEYKRNTESRMMWFGVCEEFVQQYLPQKKLNQLVTARKKTHEKKQKIKHKISSTKTRIKS